MREEQKIENVEQQVEENTTSEEHVETTNEEQQVEELTPEELAMSEKERQEGYIKIVEKGDYSVAIQVINSELSFAYSQLHEKMMNELPDNKKMCLSFVNGYEDPNSEKYEVKSMLRLGPSYVVFYTKDKLPEMKRVYRKNKMVIETVNKNDE